MPTELLHLVSPPQTAPSGRTGTGSKLWGCLSSILPSTRIGKEARTPMSMPLVLTGPGGDYRTAVVEENGCLVRRTVHQPLHEVSQTVACPSALARDPRAAARFAQVLGLVAAHRPGPEDWTQAKPSCATQRVVTLAPTENAQDESHAQTTAHCPAHPRQPRRAWLFADDAGTRRHTRRQQGHGLRTRRRTHQEGRTRSRAEQGTLFVAC